MEKEIKNTPVEELGDEELNKAISTLVDETFPELKKAREANPDVTDSKTTADAALATVPGSKNDKSRGAGRPKEISDVPNKDEDGARAKEYDSAIKSRDDDEEENPEAKKQSRSIDQTTTTGHSGDKKPTAPKMAPFIKKGEDFEKSYERFTLFEQFRKSEATTAETTTTEVVQKAVEEAPKEEVLSKSDDLMKAMVEKETSELKKTVETLTTFANEQAVLLKSIGAKPMPSKAISDVQAIEKSIQPEVGNSTHFSKAEKLDAAFELAKAGKISVDVVSELEMLSTVSDNSAKQQISNYLLNGGKV